MRLLHRPSRFQDRNKLLVFQRCFKWVLWVSLCLYLVTSCLIHHNQATTTSTKQASHSLSDDVKIYVYDLPAKYNTRWLSDDRCGNHLFASEVAIHKALLGSRFHTTDPRKADFYFVPVYVSCNFSTGNGFPAIGHARGLIGSAVKLISSGMEFWNRSNGSDHVFVASHDFGACFHTLEDVGIADGIPGFMRNSIVLQTFGVKYNHPCQQVENLVIPPYISPSIIRSTLSSAPSGRPRDIWVFFRGKMELHPKNVSGRFYSKRVRTVIWETFNEDPKFYLRRTKYSGYQWEMARSVFCLCPLGWAPWSPRLVESVSLGCVPVIIADGIRLPFPETVKWPDISLTIPESQVSDLANILRFVAATNLSDIQRNLWDPANREALMFGESGVTEGDATWHVLSGLSRLLDRSHRHRRASF